MIYLYAFLIGGFICSVAELIKNFFKLTNGHITVLFVVIGVLLDYNSFYDKLIGIAGAGAMLPITNFGHNLLSASLAKAKEIGFIGIFTGIYDKTSAGIAFTIILSVVIAIIFKPKK